MIGARRCPQLSSNAACPLQNGTARQARGIDLCTNPSALDKGWRGVAEQYLDNANQGVLWAMGSSEIRWNRAHVAKCWGASAESYLFMDIPFIHIPYIHEIEKAEPEDPAFVEP